MTDARRIVYEALLLAEDGKGGMHLTGDVLDKYSYLDRTDRSFIKRLIEGTIERRITLDHVLDLYSKVPVKKMKKQIKVLLRMGTYQLLYMDTVTDFAAVNETVKLAKKTGLSSLSGFVNGVLRNISRNRDNITWPDGNKDPVRYLSVYYSCPEWIVNKLVSEQGREHAESILALSVSTRPVTARVNTSRASVEDALSKCSGTRSDIFDQAIVLDDYDNISSIPAFADGLITIQDISSMISVSVAGIQKGDTVLDLCAAPGGKSLHAADVATDGKVIAFDVSEKKTDKIRENIKRCDFKNIEVRVNDATVFDESLESSADVVIADVPCSGLGVMGRKNDIKYNVSEQSVDDLAAIQKKILDNAARYVKEGGTLLFSTCTCSKAENEDNVVFLTAECGLKPCDFYEELPQMLRSDTAKQGYIQLYGEGMKTDGFFMAKFTK